MSTLNVGTIKSITNDATVFQKSNGKITEFHLSAFKGQIYSVQDVEVPDPEPITKRWTLYGEEIDKQ